MYFNNKKDTNIDEEFGNNNLLSQILNILNKYKKIIFIGIIILILLIMIMLFTNRKVTNYLVLNGEEIITIYQGADYIEEGFEAYNSKNDDITNRVIIKSTLNTDKIGEYEITYAVGDIIKIRKINVIAKPKEHTYIYLKTVDNDINIYLKLGETYNEPGYQAFNSTGKNLTNEVEVIGKVDTSKVGNYKLIYSVKDANNVTVSVTRTVIVMDTEISLSLSPDQYTNKEVNINIGIIDNYYDYMILPNNTKVTKSTYTYKVNNNGTYTFKVYNKKGTYKEASIDVKNIDKTPPTGSCNGSYGNGTSSINITANDTSGIQKYTINGRDYTTSNIVINGEFKSANVTIYDKAGNTNNISCSLIKKSNNESQNNKPIISDKSITFSYEYTKPDGYMPYALFTPSMAKNNKKTPLIIWLHGIGEVFKGEYELTSVGMPATLKKWNLEGFNAYVLCPQLTGSYSGTWHSGSTKVNLDNLLNKIIKEKNIDTNKIIISGHSLGGQGALYMAAKSNIYSALVVYSGYYPQTPINGITIPALGYIGTTAAGEAETSITHMKKYFAGHFGEDKLITFNVGHNEVPKKALTLDSNGDNKSDLIEWMLRQ